MNVHHELHVCAICLCELANGDAPFTDGEREAHYASVNRYGDQGLHVVAIGESFGFERSRCELCDGLAGDRYSAVTLDR